MNQNTCGNARFGGKLHGPVAKATIVIDFRYDFAR
jgi:hypothetical protein